jgi:hypothetical protein
MWLVPHEVDVGGVFLSPLLCAGALGLFAAWLTAMLLNRYRLSRFFFYPPVVFVAMVVIYGTVFATFVIPG